MMKQLLVCTDGSRNGDTACEYAIYLAKQLDASLTGLHVLDSRMLEGPLMADISGWIGAQPYGDQLQQFREMLEQKGQAIVSAFDERRTDAGLPGKAIMRMGHPARILVDEEADTDLVIIGQRGAHADLLGDALGSTAERVVRHSEKPCLVVPANFRPITKILVAFDGSEHASHALRAAVSLAPPLEAELIVLTVVEDEGTENAEAVSAQGMTLVEAEKGKAVNLISEDKRSAPAIIDNAVEQDCDLIVMGAYGHSRIREWILGSTTTHVITHADRPVMLVR